MLYKKIYYVGLAIYATLSRTTYGANYVAYAAKNPHTCGSAGPSDRCVFYCDDEKYKKDFDCGNAGVCEIMCDQKQCFENSIITATNSAHFIVNAGTGQKCYNQATFHLPKSGSAYFDADNNANDAFQKITIEAGTNTQSISVNCAGGDGKNECTEMQINAQTAQYLYIDAEGSEVKGPITINCPENPNSCGPHGSPCFINSLNKAKLSDISIHTLNGIPHDFNFDEGDNKWTWTDVVLQCTNMDNTAAVADADILSTRVDTNACYNAASWAPTAQTPAPTKRPTIDPTPRPTPKPTKSPTRRPTPQPTSNPTRNPTSDPSASPTKHPSTFPSESPTKSPTAFPSRSPTNVPSISPTRNPTSAPTHAPSMSPTRNPTAGPSGSPSVSPTETDPISLRVSDANTVNTGTPSGTGGDDEKVTNQVDNDALMLILVGIGLGIFGVILCLILLIRHLLKDEKKAEEAVIRIVSSTEEKTADSSNRPVVHIKAHSNLESIAQTDYPMVALPDPNTTQPQLGLGSAVQLESNAVQGIMAFDEDEGAGIPDDNDDDLEILSGITVGR